MKEKEKVLTLLQQGSLFPLLTGLERAVFFNTKVLQLLLQHKYIPLIFCFFGYSEKKGWLSWVVQTMTMFCSPHEFEAYVFAGTIFQSSTETLHIAFIKSCNTFSYNIVMSVECTQPCAKHEKFVHSYGLLTLQITPKFSSRQCSKGLETKNHRSGISVYLYISFKVFTAGELGRKQCSHDFYLLFPIYHLTFTYKQTCKTKVQS